MPPAWWASKPSWQAYHPGWEYRLWTDADLAELVRDRFPWFARTFDDYPAAIQRVDAARYLILLAYGGLYADLDIICRRSFEFLRPHAVVLPRTAPCGYSNDLMMAEPGHPLVQQLVENLEAAHRRCSRRRILPPHFRVLCSTGSLYLTAQVAASPHRHELRALSGAEYAARTDEALVRHVRGGSWHQWDSRAFGWLLAHRRAVWWIASTVLGALITVVAMSAL